MTLAVVAIVTVAAGALACGETRSPVGDECLRSEDCLSGVCSARTCVAAPPLVVGGGGEPDQTPGIGAPDGGTDVTSDGG